MIRTGLIMMMMMTVANCRPRKGKLTGLEKEKLTGLVPYENGTLSCRFYMYFRHPDYVDRKRSRIYCRPGPKSGTIIKDYNIESSTGEFYFTLSFKFSSGERARLIEGSIHKNDKPRDKVMVPLIDVLIAAKAETVCSSSEGVCLPDDASISKGHLATEPCGKTSTCYLRNHEVSFGPYGNLPTADRLFSDRYLYERSGFVQKIQIFVGDFAGTNNIITGIQVTYGSVVGPMHGGPGNTTPINCTTKQNGLFFGGAFGRARTQGTFDSFIYLLGFTETTTGDDLCVGGTDNQMVPFFNIQAPPSTTFTLAYISGTQSLGTEAMLGGLTFHFLSVSA